MIALGYGKQQISGDFFEEVGLWLLGGELTRSEEGDIWIRDLDTNVEVKSRADSCSYGVCFENEQLERNRRNTGDFPFARTWYAIFVYRNARITAKGGKKTTEMAVHHSPKRIYQFLEERVKFCLLLDLSVVLAMKATKKLSAGSLFGRPEAASVNVRISELYALTNGGLLGGLRDLRLPPDDYGTLRGDIAIDSYPDVFGIQHHRIQFPLTAVLPRGDIELAQTHFLQRGIALEAMKAAEAAV